MQCRKQKNRVEIEMVIWGGGTPRDIYLPSSEVLKLRRGLTRREFICVFRVVSSDRVSRLGVVAPDLVGVLLGLDGLEVAIS